jgi:hypothetical protein
MRQKTMFIVNMLAVLFLSNVPTAPARYSLDPQSAPSKFYSAFSFPDLRKRFLMPRCLRRGWMNQLGCGFDARAQAN